MLMDGRVVQEESEMAQEEVQDRQALIEMEVQEDREQLIFTHLLQNNLYMVVEEVQELISIVMLIQILLEVVVREETLVVVMEEERQVIMEQLIPRLAGLVWVEVVVEVVVVVLILQCKADLRERGEAQV